MMRRHRHADVEVPTPTVAPTEAPTETPSVSVATEPAPLRFGLVQIDARTFVKPNSTIASVTAMDGYLFSGIPYVEAATFWYEELYSKPGYVPLPPITSVSTTTTVSGTVEGGNQPA